MFVILAVPGRPPFWYLGRKASHQGRGILLIGCLAKRILRQACQSSGLDLFQHRSLADPHRSLPSLSWALMWSQGYRNLPIISSIVSWLRSKIVVLTLSSMFTTSTVMRLRGPLLLAMGHGYFAFAAVFRCTLLQQVSHRCRDISSDDDFVSICP